jgi:hypothetical protein
MCKYVIKTLHKSIQTSLDSLKFLFVSEAGITDLSKKYKKECKFLWICRRKIIISNRISNDYMFWIGGIISPPTIFSAT